jgi:hypothetical protein
MKTNVCQHVVIRWGKWGEGKVLTDYADLIGRIDRSESAPCESEPHKTVQGCSPSPCSTSALCLAPIMSSARKRRKIKDFNADEVSHFLHLEGANLLPDIILGEILPRMLAIERQEMKLLSDETQKSMSPCGDLRLVCKATAYSFKMPRMRVNQMHILPKTVQMLKHLVNATECVHLFLAVPPGSPGHFYGGKLHHAGRWKKQQDMWPILFTPEIIQAFAGLRSLHLTGSIAADKNTYKFLAEILTHADCKIQAIHCGESCNHWQPLYDDGDNTNDESNKASITRLDALLSKAIAENKTVKKFTVSGPYQHVDQDNNMCSVAKPWFDGLLRRTGLEGFRYWGLTGVPNKQLADILRNNMSTLAKIDVFVPRQDELEAFLTQRYGSVVKLSDRLRLETSNFQINANPACTVSIL